MTPAWTTPSEIKAKVRRRWDDGSLLRAHLQGEFPPIEVPIRGPSVSELGDNLAAVREWIEQLRTASSSGLRFDLTFAQVGGRHFGRNPLPARAIVSLEQAWALLGVGDEVAQFGQLVDLANDVPAVRQWIVRQPLRALDLAEHMPRLIAAYRWLDSRRDSQQYLREITAPGVDTKFAESHRAVLAAMLGVRSSAGGFLADLGLRSKPDLVRIRVSSSLGLPPQLSELGLLASELATLPLRPRSVLIIENEVTYLSAPVPPDGMVIWGKGFHVGRVGQFPWIEGVPVTYWGDIDTYGFAILDRLRASLPTVTSVLMNRTTLLAHRDRWVTEDKPAKAALQRLTVEEAELYDDLVTDRLGTKVRLEQELVDWATARSALREALGDHDNL